MEITPNEMRNHQFGTSMRGYNKAEVDAFVQGAADALEEARAELQKLKKEKSSLITKYEELRRIEDSIKAAVIEAQKTADQIKINANKEAELIITEAKQHRDRIVDEQNNRITELEITAHQIEQAKNSFYAKLRAEILAHLKLVDSIVTKEGDKKASSEPEQHMDMPPEPSPAHEEPTTSEPPPIDMREEEIESVVDQFGESSEENKEEVGNGQSQGNDF